jgi:hypothetical protein
MTIDDEKKQYEESNIAVVTAVPEPGMITAVGVKEDGIPAGPPVPPGHARFYCEKCRSVSSLEQYNILCLVNTEFHCVDDAQ